MKFQIPIVINRIQRRIQVKIVFQTNEQSRYENSRRNTKTLKQEYIIETNRS